MKPVTDNPRYLVSKEGRVFNKKRGTELKQHPNSKGYMRVWLWYGTGDKPKAVHRLVAEAFIKNPRECAEVNHIDDIRTNNNMDNLEWCTRLENEQHKHRKR